MYWYMYIHVGLTYCSIIYEINRDKCCYHCVRSRVCVYKCVRLRRAQGCCLRVSCINTHIVILFRVCGLPWVFPPLRVSTLNCVSLCLYFVCLLFCSSCVLFLLVCLLTGCGRSPFATEHCREKSVTMCGSWGGTAGVLDWKDSKFGTSFSEKVFKIDWERLGSRLNLYFRFGSQITSNG